MPNSSENIDCSEMSTARKKLADKIWITRKSRICASERLLKSASYVEFINVYYSIALILFSLLTVSPFVKGTEMIISYMSIAGSVALTISIIFANSLCYRQRALGLKQNYIDLQLLMAELDAIQDPNKKDILSIEKEYADLLSSVENHQHIDFINVLRTNNIEGHSMTGEEWLYYVCYNVWHWFWKILFVLLPGLSLFCLR